MNKSSVRLKMEAVFQPISVRVVIKQDNFLDSPPYNHGCIFSGISIQNEYMLKTRRSSKHILFLQTNLDFF